MLPEILWALALTVTTVALHIVVTHRGIVPVSGAWRPLVPGKWLQGPILILVRLVSGLLLLHLTSMVIWALAFWGLGIFPDFETSVYFSATSYTTVGYGDVIPEKAWRLLGPIESAVGILMLGLSTGVIVAGVERVFINRI